MKISDNKPVPLVILDKSAVWTDEKNGRIAHWTETDVPHQHLSIPALVDERQDSLKEEYLAWIHDLSVSEWKGRTIIDQLRITESLSFWWMTLIAEKDPKQNQNIYVVFKLRVLEKIYFELQCQGIILCSRNRILHQILRDWSFKLGHPYRWEKKQKDPSQKRLDSLQNCVPHPLRAFYWISKELWTRRRYFRGVRSLPIGGSQVSLFVYFPNIRNDLAAGGIYRSHYMEDIHDLIEKNGWIANWFWIYVPNNEYSLKDAIDLRTDFDRSSGGKANYYFLEEFLSGRTLRRGLSLYLRLARKAFLFRSIGRRFCFAKSTMNFWRIFNHAWKSSIIGTAAMSRCLRFAVIQDLVHKLPYQQWCLYLWEKQPWERALTAIWKSRNQGRIIGYQHSTLPLLDLRNIEDRRTYSLDSFQPTLPDILAVNGPGPLTILEQSGFPDTICKVVEATRYLELSRNMKLRGAPKRHDQRRTLLIVTGLFYEETVEQIRLLGQAAAAGALHGYGMIIIKPHPFCPVKQILSNNAPNIQASELARPLEQLWPKADVVYSANSTSAALEAVLWNLPIIIHKMADSLNLSPLYNWPGIDFVTKTKDLVELLKNPQIQSSRPEYFCLDEGLARWAAVLTPESSLLRS